MSDIIKVKREAKRIAEQANNFRFEWWHVIPGIIILGLAIYGGITLLHKFGGI